MDATTIGDRQTKRLDKHHAPWQHRIFPQVFGLCLLFYSQKNKREIENERGQKEKRRYQGDDMVTRQLFVCMYVGVHLKGTSFLSVTL